MQWNMKDMTLYRLTRSDQWSDLSLGLKSIFRTVCSQCSTTNKTNSLDDTFMSEKFIDLVWNSSEEIVGGREMISIGSSPQGS